MQCWCNLSISDLCAFILSCNFLPHIESLRFTRWRSKHKLNDCIYVERSPGKSRRVSPLICKYRTASSKNNPPNCHSHMPWYLRYPQWMGYSETIPRIPRTTVGSGVALLQFTGCRESSCWPTWQARHFLLPVQCSVSQPKMATNVQGGQSESHHKTS